MAGVFQTKNGPMMTLLALLCTTMAVSVGCKTEDASKTNTNQMAANTAVPFHRAWVKPGFDKSKYSTVNVAPVNSAYMLKMTQLPAGVPKEKITSDTQVLAVYAEQALKKAFRADPNQRMDVTTPRTNAPGTLIIEAALIEVVPSKLVLNSLNLPPFSVGTSAGYLGNSAKDVTTVTLEARIRDAATGEVVATMSDRQGYQMDTVSDRDLKWYSTAETAIDQVADKFVEVANRKPTDQAAYSTPITLQPW